MLEAAEKEAMGVAALTGLGRENGEALLERIGLSPDQVTVLSISHPISLKESENQWVKACRMLSCSPGNGIAVATNGDSTKAAMAIGLKTVGLPDKFTSCQDFGGADYVVDSLSDVNFQDLLALLDTGR